VKLTVEELKARAESAAQTQAELDAAEEEEKTHRAQHKATMERHETNLRFALLAIRTGTELRPVDVIDRKDFKKGVLETVRTDTGSIVRDRPLSESERQPDLGLTEKKKPRKKRKPQPHVEPAPDPKNNGEKES